MSASGSSVSEALSQWLSEAAGEVGPPSLRPLSGGNSNETLLLSTPTGEWVMRRPPGARIDASAHNLEREATMLRALEPTRVPTPGIVGLCADDNVPEAPFLLMEKVDAVSVTERVPSGDRPDGDVATAIGTATIDALADLHSLPWGELGLEEFGRPDGFLERQVSRWRKQYESYRHRELADFDPVAEWLEANRPRSGPPGVLHGDFHVDNCLIRTEPEVSVEAVIDWEMSTIGDPLLDVGLMLAFWGGDRPQEPAMPTIQGFSRVVGAATREELAERYEARSGRSLEHLGYYMALAFWKLAAIVEGAHAQYVAGRVDTEYAAALERDVPRLLAEAREFTGLQ